MYAMILKLLTKQAIMVIYKMLFPLCITGNMDWDFFGIGLLATYWTFKEVCSRIGHVC